MLQWDNSFSASAVFERGFSGEQSFFGNCKTNADSMLTGHIASFVLYCGSFWLLCGRWPGVTVVWLTLFHISHRRCATGNGLLRCATSVVGHYFCAFGIFIWPPFFLGASSTSLGGANGPLAYSTVPVVVGQSSSATPPVWSPPTTMITNPPLPPSPANSGVCLSPGLEPVPQKLADRVCSGAYVEMRDLLGDNISLLRELESVNIATTLPALPGTMKPRLRELSSLASRLYCFLAYMALRCPDRETRDRLVYACLIIKEAQRHGGQRWLAYDMVFRQHAALDPSIQWNVLHPAIQASTLFGPASCGNQSPTTSGGSFCSICWEVDHTAASCALAYLQQPSSTVSTQPARQGSKRQAVASHTLCISWNRGRCLFPKSCSFRHVCSSCFQ